MYRPLIVHVVSLLSVTLLSAACTSSSAPQPRKLVTVARPAGSWQGQGNKTIGFVSESGCFRINWTIRGEHPQGGGTFRLTVRSAISGRPIQVVADHHGEGSGSADFVDDPRMYDFMVESANVEWSFTVEELFDVDANAASPSSTWNR
jgi:hypothetical protein